MKPLVHALLLLFALPNLLIASEWYVAPPPLGQPGNPGTLELPWDLATGLAGAPDPKTQQPRVRPGDTLWLLRGMYEGNFTSTLTGTTTARITVRPYLALGEDRRDLPTIDCKTGKLNALDILGSYTDYIGFEVMSSNTVRTSKTPGVPPPLMCDGVNNSAAPNNRLVNLIIHDLSQGIEWFADAQGGEVYGNIVYYNGWNGPEGDSAHGHGIYTQNDANTPEKLISDNIFFRGFSAGIHAFGETTGQVSHFRIEKNASFLHGEIGKDVLTRDFILSGAAIAENPTLRNNYFYSVFRKDPPAPPDPGGRADFGLSSNRTRRWLNGVVEDNYIVAGLAPSCPALSGDPPGFACTENLTALRNTFYGTQLGGLNRDTFPNNTFCVPPPKGDCRLSGIQTFVTPNQYEPGRGHVVVFNWDRADNVQVNLSPILNPGEKYIIVSAQNFKGPIIKEGIFDGKPVLLPMTGDVLNPAAPSCLDTPSCLNATNTGPEFQAFLVLCGEAGKPCAPR